MKGETITALFGCALTILYAAGIVAWVYIVVHFTTKYW